jgi:Uma2 family endonuclease
MSTATQLLTAEDLWNMPGHGGRVELVKGEIRTMSPTGYDHGIITARLTARLVDYVDANDLGGVTAAECGYIVIRDPDTVRAPDVAFVRKDRIPKTGRPVKFWVGPPDLAVETMSPSDTVFEVDEKVREWLAAGTRLVWVLNPRQQTVSVYRPDNTARILTIVETLDGEDVIPGFQIALAQLYR